MADTDVGHPEGPRGTLASSGAYPSPLLMWSLSVARVVIQPPYRETTGIPQGNWGADPVHSGVGEGAASQAGGTGM